MAFTSVYCDRVLSTRFKTSWLTILMPRSPVDVGFFTFIGYNKEPWWYSFTQSIGSELKSTSTCNEILDAKFFKRYIDKGSSTIRPGFSAWWFLVAIGIWNSYWRHLNNTYSTRARWIHLTLSVVVVVFELGGEENILLASPPSWRRMHHATLEPGRACKKRLQVLLQNITVLKIQYWDKLLHE